MKSVTQSEAWFEKAQKIIPGGVNSPVRACHSVGTNPRFMVSGKGAIIQDVDGNEYIDFCGSWGPLILGHARPEIVSAVQNAAASGLSFGACTPSEVKIAELLCRLIPSMEMVRLVTSGTEATMTALRLARAFTHRNKIIKFEGCYHGHSDAFLIAAGSGLLTHGIPSSAGVTEAVANDTLVVPYNDLDALRKMFESHPDQIAAVIIEPVAGNMGLVMPKKGYLETVCELAATYGALTIFDEVINGFRFAPTTYAEINNLKPDLTTLGKIIGGGLPIGAIGGRRDILSMLAPLGPVYQAGTLSGNPVATAAGIATLTLLENENPYPELTRKTEKLANEINAAFKESGIPGHCAHAGALFTIFFTNTPAPLKNLTEVKTCDTARFGLFFRTMLEAGFYFPPAQFETAFVSAAHTDTHFENFLTTFRQFLKSLKN